MSIQYAKLDLSSLLLLELLKTSIENTDVPLIDFNVYDAEI